jgi:hypothetical protein
MTIDERLKALTQTVELLAGMHKDNETLMREMMLAITRLANIADAPQRAAR